MHGGLGGNTWDRSGVQLGLFPRQPGPVAGQELRPGTSDRPISGLKIKAELCTGTPSLLENLGY